MKKDDVAEALMQESKLESKAQAKRIIEAMLNIITKALSRGEEVTFTGFGTFKVAKRAARVGINPKTGEKIQIAATTKPKFRPGKELKEAVK
jgi:DNA-binding protein HU-beta